MPLYQPGAGVSDHGALTGLADDDHTAYSTNTEFDSHNARHYSGGDDELLLDDLGLPATNVDLNSKKLTSVLDPVDPQDAATKAYVDAASAAAHIADATDAHDASAISFDDTGLGITAADVQTMGEQLDAAIAAGGIPATIFDAAGDIIVASAADTAARLAKGADASVLSMVAGAVAWAEVPGRLIGLKYEAAAHTYSTTSATLADVDAANMVVTFTAPASGNVLVRLTAFTDNSATGGGNWGLRESTTNLIRGVVNRDADPGGVRSIVFCISGISGGSHTYKWAFASSAGQDHRIQTTDGSAVVAAGTPATMEVWAAP